MSQHLSYSTSVYDKGWPYEMCDSDRLKLQDCKHLGRENGLDIYVPKMTTHIYDKDNKIKIIHIGNCNSLATKNVMLIGETGAGKTTILNGMANHLWDIQFGDTFRLKIPQDDDASGKQAFDSQTEGITGYLFYVNHLTNYNYNIMIIDTPGLNDTRGYFKHRQIMSQMKLFLKDEKYGIIDLHCLAFVVKANFNRCLEYYGKIFEESVKLFGRDTESITQILKTHAVDKNNSIRDIFKKCYNISVDSEFHIDNGPLYEPNKVGINDKFGVIAEESDIQMKGLRWTKQVKEWDTFLQILFRMPSVSMQLTRTALREKIYLEQAKVNLSEKMKAVLKHIIANKDNRKMLRDYMDNKESNKNWSGQETVIEKRTLQIFNDLKWYHFAAHVHNCIKCEKTCSTICHLWIPCPSLTSTCLVCNCKNDQHVRSEEIIQDILVIKNVTLKDMDEKYDNCEDNFEKDMKLMKQEEEMYTQIIATMTKYVCFLTERLNHLSRVQRSPSAKEITKEIIKNLIQEDTKLTDQLDEDCKSFMQSVFEEIDQIKVNSNNWIRDLEEIMEFSDSAWKKASTGSIPDQTDSRKTRRQSKFVNRFLGVNTMNS